MNSHSISVAAAFGIADIDRMNDSDHRSGSTTTRTATVYDVADAAGVSQSAVSRAFTPGASISQAKRERVLAAAEALGYRPNLLARSLTTRRSNLVGLAVGNLENSFFTTLLDALSGSLADAGLRLLMFTARTNAQVDAQIEDVLRYRVDALVLLATVMTEAMAGECAAAGIPTIFINRAPGDAGTECGLSGDNSAGVAAIASHLIERGYRRFAFMAGIPNATASIDRAAVFDATLAAHGLPPAIREAGLFTRAGATAAMHALLARADRPDAVFCANDHMGCAAIDAVRAAGLVPGRDIGIAAFDDVPMAAWPAYDLTTYSVPVDTLAAAVTDLIRTGRQPSAPRRITIPGELKVRGSTRR